jgi:hypothetical protein
MPVDCGLDVLPCRVDCGFDVLPCRSIAGSSR